MLTLRFKHSELTFNSTTFIFRLKLADIKNKQLILDFRNITFIDPFGMMFLKSLLNMLSSNNEILVRFQSENVINYLARMAFNEHFLPNTNVTFDPNLHKIKLRSKDLSDRLIELKSYHIRNDDDVENLTNEIIEIVSPKIEYYKSIQDLFYTAIAETVSNIQIHSGLQEALVCLQTYGNSIIIAISDDGIGIKNGLKEIGHGLSDADAIEKALEPGVSSREGGGGMGLTELSEKIKIRHDSLGIRSKSGYLIIENGVIHKGGCGPLPGTQILIKLQKH